MNDAYPGVRAKLLSALILVAATAQAAPGPDCARRLGEAAPAFANSAPVHRTRMITAEAGDDVEVLTVEDAIGRSRSKDPALFRGVFKLALAPFLGGKESLYGPLNFLRADEFDPELQGLIAQILREAHAEVRLAPAIAALVRKIRRERADALRHYRANRAHLAGYIDASTLAHWRDQTTVEPRARETYRRGLEVGAWVVTLASGRRLILPLFSDARASAHSELAPFRPIEEFLRTLPAEEDVRSAALFHNHPNGSPVLSIKDFDATAEMVRHFWNVGEFHIYAIAEIDGRVELGHYGVRR